MWDINSSISSPVKILPFNCAHRLHVDSSIIATHLYKETPLAIGGLTFEAWGGDNLWTKDEEYRQKMFEKLKREFILNPEFEVYSTLGSNVLLVKDILFRPEGLLYKVVRKEEELYEGKNWWREYSHRGLEDISVYKDFFSREVAATYYYFAAEHLDKTPGNR